MIGMIGAGQLARMSLPAATALDLDLRLLAISGEDGAAKVWPRVAFGNHDDRNAVREFARTCDIVTFDHELVPPELVRELDAHHTVRPGPKALLAAQDKLHQRALFTDLDLPVPNWIAAADIDRAVTFASQTGWPVALKAPRGTYDGRGVAIVANPAELQRVWSDMSDGRALLIEEAVQLDREIAVLVARSPSGQQATWPVIDTLQRDGILVELAAPSQAAPALRDEATLLAQQIAAALDLVGVMAVEMFIAGGRLWINEIAVRPHNSGHWTIEGAVTSQFEQHLRAVADLPLGSTEMTSDSAVTANLLGPADGSNPATRLADTLAITGVHVHLYGKTPRPGRKLGHVTACGTDLSEVRQRARKAIAVLQGDATNQGIDT